MQTAISSRALAGFVTCALAIALAPPSSGQPGAPVPGNGVFRVGSDMAPGTYQTQGPSTPPRSGVRRCGPDLILFVDDLQHGRNEQG